MRIAHPAQVSAAQQANTVNLGVAVKWNGFNKWQKSHLPPADPAHFFWRQQPSISWGLQQAEAAYRVSAAAGAPSQRPPLDTALLPKTGRCDSVQYVCLRCRVCCVVFKALSARTFEAKSLDSLHANR